jgi:hypothetical protein
MTPQPVYSFSGYFILTVPAGAASTNLVVVPLSDEEAEGPETALLTLVETPAYVVIPPAEATITIEDAQTPPKPAVSTNFPLRNLFFSPSSR